MYSIIPAANGPIKCYRNSERYSALAMEHLSLAEGYPVQPCSIAAKRNRAGPSGLKSRFMSSAKLPVKGGIANSPQVRCRLQAAGWLAAKDGAKPRPTKVVDYIAAL